MRRRGWGSPGWKQWLAEVREEEKGVAAKGESDKTVRWPRKSKQNEDENLGVELPGRGAAVERRLPKGASRKGRK